MESDVKLAVNVSGSLLSNLLSWHKSDDNAGAKEVEMQRKKPEAVPVSEEIRSRDIIFFLLVFCNHTLIQVIMIMISFK